MKNTQIQRVKIALVWRKLIGHEIWFMRFVLGMPDSFVEQSLLA